MSAIFLLGPDQWEEGLSVDPPAWISPLLGRGAVPFDPRKLRVALSILLERESAGKCRGIVMDPQHQLPGEDDADYFERLESEPDLAAYFIVVPARAKMQGTIFEGGMLRRDFKYGRKPVIALFLEARAVKPLGGGAYEFLEKGQRTRYLRSLVKKASHVELWDSLEGLREAVLQRALVGLG